MTFRGKFFVPIGFCLLVLTLPFSATFPSGAPASPTICSSMNPEEGHGSPPQTSPFPYTVTLSKTAATGGDSVTVTISTTSQGPKIKGFLVQARLEGKTIQEGSFKNILKSSKGEDVAKTLNCGAGKNSAVTHTDNDEKDKVSFDWEAPNESGSYNILVTVIENFGAYWVAQKGGTVTVTKSETAVRSTTEPPPSTLSPEGQTKISEIYQGCGDSKADIPKGCFGLPGDCLSRQDCDSLVTFRSDGDNGVTLELLGKAKSYVALGLSKDQSMGDDVVFGCRKEGNRFVVEEYYNRGKEVATGVRRDVPYVSREQGSEVDGVITCKFNVKGSIETSMGTLFDVKRDTENFLLLSRGDSSGREFLGKHEADAKGASPARVSLTDIVHLGERSPILLQLHGSFMIMAWLLCASVGMFTARYYKNTLTSANPCGVAFWFAVHRPLMAIVLLLTIAGFIVIFIEVGEWTTSSTDIAEYYHPILGTVVTALTILQVLIAFCRPPPNKKFRFLFNWVHWLFGNSAYIIGIACIFLANNLEKTRLKGRDEFWGILVAFIAVHVIVHIVMSIHTLKADRHMEIRNKKRAVLPGPMKLSGSDTEAPGTAFRMILLVVYLLAAAGTASALTYFAVVSFE